MRLPTNIMLPFSRFATKTAQETKVGLTPMTIGQLNYEAVRASAPDDDHRGPLWDKLADWQRASFEAGAQAVLENHEIHEKSYGRGMPA